MSKKKAMVLGYTRTGLPVLLPTSSTPDMKQFADWTRGDHRDASSILAEHGEREPDPKIGSWCTRWASAHRALGKSSKEVHVRGAAETSIRPKRQH